ncbi:hypothetical protein ZIOFF_055178 [Zingiber officinale]|uniref:Alpha-1,3-mannosyl-glycoprotein 2-beta-N-acetylglucosaminyltransferase n=1 Tax=Zingiber officinale TaxID=94328 RepID=A0A8J5FG12_ZINOF|nr:hypothetical protein ZIOFF_055178 [Zingiber officinale]
MASNRAGFSLRDFDDSFSSLKSSRKTDSRDRRPAADPSIGIACWQIFREIAAPRPHGETFLRHPNPSRHSNRGLYLHPGFLNLLLLVVLICFIAVTSLETYALGSLKSSRQIKYPLNICGKNRSVAFDQKVRLFTAQSEYAERLAAVVRYTALHIDTSVVESENRCTSQMRLLIDQISTQQGKIVALEEANKYKDEESAQLKTLLQDLKKKSLQNLIGKNEEPVAAVVIMACNRPDYLERTVKSVLKYQRSVSSKFPLFISQDGTNPDVKTKAMSYNEIIYLQHVDLKPVATERPGEITAYYKIARHYKWALDELFVSHKFNRVIILEDDMEIAPDFFDYFEATATLLDKDKTIMAVSSWNDNGQKQFVHDPRALYRSDFFPGLGWMLTKSTWDELSPKWPKAYP